MLSKKNTKKNETHSSNYPKKSSYIPYNISNNINRNNMDRTCLISSLC